MAPLVEEVFTGITLREPTNRRKLFSNIHDWIEGKKTDDGAEGLWRVHDKLYDVTHWMTKHPGGKQWLEVTKGTDITEAFECTHLSDNTKKILETFYIRNAKTPRNSLITFHEDGFFKTLLRKINKRKLLHTNQPAWKAKFLADGLAVLVFTTGLLATFHSYWWTIASGLSLNMLAVVAHNFFHKRNNWRMYYFSLTLMSPSEWRVSHVLSHHLYPNTMLDLEITMFEPFFRFLPSKDKRFRYLSWIITPFVFASLLHFQFARRVSDVLLLRKLGFQTQDLFAFIFPAFLFVFDAESLWKTFVIWNTIIVFTSFFFALVGLTAAHHHPDIYHDGDFLGRDKDFGIIQLAAVRDRVHVDGNFFLTMILFGEHALHHLFPTVDHEMLPLLKSVFEETCKEFNISFKPVTVGNLIVGMFQQLVRNYKNSKLSIMKEETVNFGDK